MYILFAVFQLIRDNNVTLASLRRRHSYFICLLLVCSWMSNIRLAFRRRSSSTVKTATKHTCIRRTWLLTSGSSIVTTFHCTNAKIVMRHMFMSNLSDSIGTQSTMAKCSLATCAILLLPAHLTFVAIREPSMQLLGTIKSLDIHVENLLERIKLPYNCYALFM